MTVILCLQELRPSTPNAVFNGNEALAITTYKIL